ncbi:alpha/beta fold hydrolase [Streptomyces sp. NPDC032472]|uniref:alpha/beta fold hydrolase n=1 Tax=Streptomyces sp. NPDC032472 TaxID=3155018 RepID=UPI00340E2314
MAPIKHTDHAVEHKSTVPANYNLLVKLFVREYDGTPEHTPPEKRRAVLMLHGRTVPVLAVYDIGLGDYSWSRVLAHAGYDVFMMDLQGMGLSPRPEMDSAYNGNPAQHDRVTYPNLPLPSDGPPTYPHQLGNSQSDWDEVHTVVEYIKDLHGVKQVDLIGNSAAAFALGPYAIQHKDNVRSLMFQAPVFPPNGTDSAPGTEFGAPVPLPTNTPPYPMALGNKAGVEAAWKAETSSDCPSQKAPGIVDTVWEAIMASDPVGRTWGKPLPGGGAEGINRQRQTFWWGWNKKTAPLHGTLGGPVPVFIVYGDLDKTVTTGPLSVTELYKAIAGENKLMFKVSCASHQMPWEGRRTTLQTMSKQWLKHGKVFGKDKGSFHLDDNDDVTPQPVP